MDKLSWDHRYRPLAFGEIIEAGDECRRDDGTWVTGICVGEPAPDPAYTSHRVYRRPTPANGEQVERIAEVLMLYDLDHNGNWPVDKVRGALGYRDSEHSGDCTKQPWTCMRCACDEVYKVARAVAATLPAPTEDARSRVKVLEGLDRAAYDLAMAAGQLVVGTDEMTDLRKEREAVLGALRTYADARDTALGNKETDRHG